MDRKEIGTQWDRLSRNNINHNFIELYNEYSTAGLNAKAAAAKALEAMSESHKALLLSNETRQQLIDIILENGDSSAEVVQARGGEQVLDDRLRKIPVKEVDIKTTTGRYWSTDTNDLIHTINNQEIKVRVAPMTTKKTLVVFGSSTSEGFYATDGNSWFDKLKAALEDWDVLQRGWSGDNTTRAIGRFHKDVAPYNPDVCILAFTLGNEGMTKEQTLEQKEEKCTQFKNNILTLAHMCRQNGCVPIIVDQSPTRRYDAEMYRLSAELNKEIDSLGYMTINFKGAIDALHVNGIPITQAMYDELHPNDIGHNAMFKAINPSMFKYLTASTSLPSVEYKEGWIATPGNPTGQDMPIIYTPQTDIDTFTVFFRMKAVETVVAQRTWAGIGNGSLRISNQDNDTHTLDLRGGGMANAIISDVGLDDKKPHSVAVTYNSISKFIKFYVDGKLIGTDSAPNLKLTELILASRRVDAVFGTNMAYKDLAVYRTRLSDDQIHDLHKGIYPKGSLDLFAPMNDVPKLNAKLTNLSPTDDFVRINTSSLISY